MLMVEIGIFVILFLFGWVGWILGKIVLLLINWFFVDFRKDCLIVFSYLVGFGVCIIFNMFDVSLFDL